MSGVLNVDKTGNVHKIQLMVLTNCFGPVG